MTDGSNGVERRAHVDRRTFAAEYVRPSTPVILTDAIDHWAALSKWTPRFFRERYGGRSVTVDGRSYQLAELLDLVETSSAASPGPYMRNVLIEGWAPELLADVLPLPDHTHPNWLESRFFPSRPSLTSVELYIGGAGAAFPVLHYDNLHTHAFLMQIYGSKEYVFYAPDEGRYLYPRCGVEANKSAVDHIEHPDPVRFPLFARAKMTRCHLRPGEMLFVPAGWWHTARILEPAITVSANTVNAANWRAFFADYVSSAARHRPPMRVAALSAYLRLFGLIAHLVSF